MTGFEVQSLLETSPCFKKCPFVLQPLNLTIFIKVGGVLKISRRVSEICAAVGSGRCSVVRKYGSVPHTGFGLGLERTVAWICGLPHIRETIPYARLMNRKYP
jgi:hypothetical protein